MRGSALTVTHVGGVDPFSWSVEMQRTEKFLTVCGLFFVAALGLQFLAAQRFEIAALQRELRIAERSKAIEEDQTRELMYQLSQLRAEKEFSDTRQYVLGVVAAITKPDQYQAIWHAGYDRGSAVQKDVDNPSNAVYTSQSK